MNLTNAKRIIHIDMDAFFASVEMRDNPTIANKPVIVGGSPDKRGVVSAANYLARKQGVRSGESMKSALQKCPEAIRIKPHFEKYKEASDMFKSILKEKTTQIESMSLDEAWLDVTSLTQTENDAYKLGLSLKEEIFNSTRLTCSVGIASNKFLAKLSSEENKPNGIFLLKKNDEHNFLMKLKLEQLSGVGPVFKKRLHHHGLYTGEDIFKLDLFDLTSRFGKMGVFLFHRVRGIDNREITPHRIRKSLGIERTFPEDISKEHDILLAIEDLFHQLWNKGTKKEHRSSIIQIKIKLKNFKVFTRRYNIPKPLQSLDEIIFHFKSYFLTLIQKEFKNQHIRLLGVTFIDLNQNQHTPHQLSLFKNL